MKKNCVQKVIIHIEENTDFHTLNNKVNEFHVNIIQRRLNYLNLTTEQKIIIIDKIIENLKLREINGIIK